MKLRSVAQEFARELGRDLPAGMEEDRGVDRHEEQAAHSDLKDKQQEERSGISKEEHRTLITEAWRTTGDGPAFVRSLETRGYLLAQGDKRAYVVVDQAGEVHSLSRRIEGVKAAAVKTRLAASHPVSSLPSVEQARQQLRQQTEQQRQTATPPPPETTDAERRAGLQAMQARRRGQLIDQRSAAQTRHTAERELLAVFQEQRRTVANDAPLPPAQGFAGFVQRFRARLSDCQQRRLLDSRQNGELKEFSRQERSLAVLEARERRSLELHLKRDDFRRYATVARRFEALAGRLEAQLPQGGVAGDLRASLRDFFAGRQTEPPAQPDRTAADAERAAERLREEQERARQLHTKFKL